MSQGDVQPLRVEGAGTATTLTATAFDRPVHLGSRSPGVWEGLLGVDVVQKAGSYPLVVTATRSDGTTASAQTTVAVTARRFTTRKLQLTRSSSPARPTRRESPPKPPASPLSGSPSRIAIGTGRSLRL